MITYIATTHIQHGAIVNDNVEQVCFFEGDVVTGIDGKSMRALWDAGAIRKKVTPNVPEEVTSTD